MPYNLESVLVIYRTSWRVRHCPWKKNVKKNLNKKFRFCIAYNTPWPPLSVHKKIQPNLSSRLAVYTQHIYTNVLFYYIDRCRMYLTNWILEFQNFIAIFRSSSLQAKASPSVVNGSSIMAPPLHGPFIHPLSPPCTVHTSFFII